MSCNRSHVASWLVVACKKGEDAAFACAPAAQISVCVQMDVNALRHSPQTGGRLT
jgi:hypothetical protein